MEVVGAREGAVVVVGHYSVGSAAVVDAVVVVSVSSGPPTASPEVAPRRSSLLLFLILLYRQVFKVEFGSEYESSRSKRQQR